MEFKHFFSSNVFYVFSLQCYLVLSETRCSTNKHESLNNNIRLTESSDTICSPDYYILSTYPTNITCKWIISSQKDNSRIKLSFSVFDLQAPSPSCQSADYVEVRDGEFSDSPILGTFCGSVKPSDVTSSGKLMLVYFRSDSLVEKRGFVCSYVSVDDEKKTGFSSIAILVGVAVVFVIVIAAVFGRSSIKKIKSRSPGRVKVLKTRPGIIIKIHPATPISSSSHMQLA